MVSSPHISFNATDRSYMAVLKKDIHSLAASAGMPVKQLAEMDIVLAEMCSNLAKYAIGGEVLARIMTDERGQYIELLCIDNGPGMGDTARMIGDGISTTGTLGHGLGSIKRLSDVFNIYSLKNWGTILLSRIYFKRHKNESKKNFFELRQLLLPKPGESACGDGVYSQTTADTYSIFLGDGLGHGPEAAAAVCAAGNAFMTGGEYQPSAVVHNMHVAAKRTRGLVGMVATYFVKEKKWLVCGVGNISCKMMTPAGPKTIMPYNGIIGVNMPSQIKDMEYKVENPHILVLNSDGLKTRWEIGRYPGILKYDHSILAAALYKDYGRKSDDTSVTITRIN